ncbi:MAG: Alginate lyase [Lacunisphaera sp.]|nr:Alginate lyase [Lacunisphaera sp.]
MRSPFSLRVGGALARHVARKLATYQNPRPLAAILAVGLGALLAATATAAEPYQLTKAELTALAADPAAALKAPIVTVVDKPQASPSGDAHDYVSFARYYWPDPTKPGGLPYVPHDGKHNREQVARGDRGRIGNFCETVVKLAAAWSVTHDEAAARRAGEWLRAWFVTPATRMNPNLEFAQVRLGHSDNHGNPAGVLDARGFAEVVDALQLLHDSPAFTAGEEEKIRTWFGRYLDWLMTAKNARDEHAAKNNHGSWFLAQAIPIARYAGRDELARQLCEEDKPRLADQLRPDGSQPEEIRRVDGLGYSAFNLEAQFHIARLAAGLGIDLWNYTAPNGASLRVGLNYLRSFNAQPGTWPATQNEKLKPGFLDPLLRQFDASPAARLQP